MAGCRIARTIAIYVTKRRVTYCAPCPGRSIYVRSARQFTAREH
jgi:hypothetical protein